MSLTPAVISTVSKTPQQVVISIDSYDAGATGHNMWRTTQAEGNPAEVGTMIGSDINPDVNFTDATVTPGETYRYQLESIGGAVPVYSTETTAYITHVETDGGEVEDKDFTDDVINFLVNNNLLANVRYGVAPYGGMILRDDEGTLYLAKAHNFNLDEDYDPEQDTAARQYKFVNGIWRCDSALSQRLPIHDIRADSIYFRWWHKLDYTTSTANDNQEVIGVVDSSNDGVRLRYDSDRPRAYIDFTDGAYDNRGDVLSNGWSLHEAMYDYPNHEWRWRISRATFESTSVQTSTRTAEATIAWGTGTGGYNFTPRGMASESFPTEVGSVFILDTVPSAQVREDWYDLDKAKYGY